MISDYTLRLISNYSNLGAEAIEEIGSLGLYDVLTLKAIDNLSLPRIKLGKSYNIYIPKYNYIYRYSNSSDGKVLTYDDISITELKSGLELGIIDREAIKVGANSIKVYVYPGLSECIREIDVSPLLNLMGTSDVDEAMQVMKNEYRFNCTEEYLRLLKLSNTVIYKPGGNYNSDEIKELCSLVDLIDRLIGRENLIDLREELMESKVLTLINDINSIDIYYKIRRAGGISRCLGRK